MVLGGVRDFDEERDRHQIKGVLLVQVAVALHHHEQIELLRQ